MELKEFIKQTITQITDGVREGHEYIVSNDYGSGVRDVTCTEVNFDIAITTNEEEKTGMGGKLNVVSFFNTGIDKEDISKSTNYNRIQFKLSVGIKTQGN
ncbi:hypothetical protein FLJC2902T_13400 [Flavobacterium limnosediminis JC2902]|uniref:Uncharacterized protein n=1 Tax=Flavobacterium limnosediminis JC2902 TaxID=1341181 RepID=V6SQ51_9FLAO|nr:hypothetical protein [Flavobacterium limnosediminis]ESU28746.1 hypothetical protein FLJC2902T_13400 [Flavobacterium limnosediminis JC2902]